MLSSGNAMVDAMAEINITGNVIPQNWYTRIVKENGRPHILATVILADIVYWYRPTEVRDEKTGLLVGFTSKFAEDMLQKSYDSYADMFGESKKCVTEAFNTLERLGLIKRYMRTIVVRNGIKVPNVMYIELFPDKVREITFDDGEDVNNISDRRIPQMGERVERNCSDMSAENGGCAECTDDTLPPKRDIPPAGIEDTNTYITLENNTESISKILSENTKEINTENSIHSFTSFSHSGESAPSSSERVMEEHASDQKVFDSLRAKLEKNINLEKLLYNHPANKKLINRMVMIMVDAMTEEEGYVYVSKENRSIDELRKRYLSLDINHIEHVLQRLPENDDDINLRDKYLLACLFNAPDTINQICKTNQIRQKESTNSFSKFKQHEYDYEELERMALSR